MFIANLVVVAKFKIHQIINVIMIFLNNKRKHQTFSIINGCLASLFETKSLVPFKVENLIKHIDYYEINACSFFRAIM